MSSNDTKKITPLIPTHIVTGFLGTGKTTAINNLISQKPSHEKWAIIINEFGQIGVDQTAMPTQDDIQIKEIAGGCVCCALGPALTINLAMLIRRAKPDRIIIEPTGLGHPSGLIDIIQGESFNTVLSLQSVICLLDPRSVDDSKTMRHETFIDQLNLADYVILNKTDLATTEQIDEATLLTEQMFPPKQAVLKTTHGNIPFSLFNVAHKTHFSAMFPDSHVAAQVSSLLKQTPRTSLMMATPAHPVMKTGFSNDAHSGGWVFHHDDIFDYDSLYALLISIKNVWRLKGVFRIGEARVLFNAVNGELSISPIAWRRDSRLEVISEAPLDWHSIEDRLLQTLTNSG